MGKSKLSKKDTIKDQQVLINRMREQLTLALTQNVQLVKENKKLKEDAI